MVTTYTLRGAFLFIKCTVLDKNCTFLSSLLDLLGVFFWGGLVDNALGGVKHWHGAAPDSWFQHLAIEVPGDGGRNEWLEPVSDEDYGKLK